MDQFDYEQFYRTSSTATPTTSENWQKYTWTTLIVIRKYHHHHHHHHIIIILTHGKIAIYQYIKVYNMCDLDYKASM